MARIYLQNPNDEDEDDDRYGDEMSILSSSPGPKDDTMSYEDLPDDNEDDGVSAAHQSSASNYNGRDYAAATSTVGSTTSYITGVGSVMSQVSHAFRRSRQPNDIPEDIDVIPEDDDDDDDDEHEDSEPEEQGTYHSRQQSQQRQIMRYDGSYYHPPTPPQQQNHHQLAPIHYHIYYTPDHPSLPPSPPSGLIPWKWIAVTAILTHLLYVYSNGGYSAGGLLYATYPWKHERSSWSDVRHHLESISTLWMWTDRFLGSSIEELSMHDSSSSSLPHLTRCTRGETNLGYTQELFSQEVVGQDRVWKEMQTSIEAHVVSAAASIAASGQHASILYPSPPLVVLATGGPGTGKRALAEALARKCDLPFHYSEVGMEVRNLVKPSSGEGDDDFDNDMRNRNQKILLTLKLISALKAHPQGMVWLVSLQPPQQRHEEEDPEHNASSVVILTKEHHDATLQILSDLYHDYPYYPWDSTIIVLKSNAGVAAIHKTIRHFGIEDIPHEELGEYLRHELFPLSDEEKDDNDDISGDEGDVTASSSFASLSSSSSWRQRLTVSTIFPFLPLTTKGIDDLFQSQLRKQGYIMEDPLDRSDLLQSTLEWETWIHTPTQTERITTLAQGGHDVIRLVQRIIPPPFVDRDDGVDQDVACPTTTDMNGEEKFTVRGLRRLQLVRLKLSSSSSLSSHSLQLRMLTCPPTRSSDYHNVGASSSSSSNECTTVCQYPIRY